MDLVKSKMNHWEEIRMEKKKSLVPIVGVVLIAVIVIAVGMNEGNYKKKLTSYWYQEGASSASFALFSDGTCQIDNRYGMGKWEVVNGNQLRMSTFFGETWTVVIESIKGGCLTLKDGTGHTVQFWNSPHR